MRSLLGENGRPLRFPRIFIKKQTRWSNDKTIIELGYRKISWFVSVSQINYLPQPSASANTWSVRHKQITIFCSTSSNNCYFLFLKPRLGDFLSTRLCAYKLYLLEILYWNHTMLIHYLMHGSKCEFGLPTRVDEEDKCLIVKYIFDPHWAKNTIINYFHYDNDQCAFYFTFLWYIFFGVPVSCDLR